MIDLPNYLLSKITNLKINSKKVSLGDTFVAIKGTQKNGHYFINEALQNGAQYIICENIPPSLKNDKRLIKVKNSRLTYSMIQEAIYNFPSKKLDLIGITGTNGKTTTTHILQALLGSRCASISTLGLNFQDKLKSSTHTTPDAAIIQKNLSELTNTNCENSIIETSAHSLSQDRLGTIKFNYVLFLNLSEDHLDYYKNMNSYFNAKSLLFSQHLSQYGLAIINGDDTYGQALCQRLARHQYISFGKNLYNDVKIKIKINCLSINYQGKQFSFIHNFSGEYNAYNLCSAILVAYFKNIPVKFIKKTLKSIYPCEGRLQKLPNHDIFIDYAHTPIALEEMLKFIKKNNPNKNIKLIFGCGGNRDQTKRQTMGAIAEKYAHKITITDDNPRNENPKKIIQDILKGIKKKDLIQVIHNRYDAIAKNLSSFSKNDILIIAGKGHEKIQIYKKEKIAFSDYDTALKLQKLIK